MFLSLGDTDEYAHAGAYGEYLGALQRADAIIGELVRVADGWGDEARRVLWFVTADHGRGDDFCNHGKSCPESQGSWLVAAGGPIPARGALSWTRPRYLRDIAPTIRALVGAPLEDRDDAGVPITEILP
jgi:bisphosphoglycerate-independent phosphoglycerate mutase (AlkP superfamily)